MNALNTKGGIALIIGALLNITRMIPVFADENVTRETFPPHTIADTIYVTQLYGWHISHVMALISVPFLAFGFAALFSELKSRNAATQGLAALIVVSTALILYLSGAVIDGLALPEATRHFGTAAESGDAAAGYVIELVHMTAVAFGGFGAALLLGSSFFVGAGLIHGFGRKKHGLIGIVLALASTAGFVTGIIELNIAKSLPIAGPLSLATFAYLISVGVLLMRTKADSQEA